MPKDSPSIAKNKMRRCFAAILDPHPSKKEINRLWRYFNSTCAYCGVPIDRSSRTGHLDHVVPTSSGGDNGIHNHVLSCSKCNGDEKREESWKTFLARKARSAEQAGERESKIETWLEGAPAKDPMSARSRALADQAMAEAFRSFDHAVETLRKLSRES